MYYQKEHDIAVYLGYQMLEDNGSYTLITHEKYPISLGTGLRDEDHAWDYFFHSIDNYYIDSIHLLCFKHLKDDHLQTMIFRYTRAMQIVCKFENGWACHQWELKDI